MNTRQRLRVLSAASFALLLAIFVTGLLLIIQNPGLALLFLLAAAVVVLGGWIILSSRGGRWWWGAVLTAVSLVATFWATWTFFADRQNLRLLILLTILAIAYSALVGLLSRQYWLARRTESSQNRSFHHPVLLINPKSGNGRATKAHLADVATGQNIQTIAMKPGQDLVKLAESAISEGADVLGISGGDGSLGVMAGVAIKHNLPLVVLPGGTRCHFARDIGLDPAQIADALAGFKGVERRVDVGQIGDRLFLNNASFGLYAHIISHQDYRDHKLDVTRRVTQELVSSDQPYYPLHFRDNTGVAWKHAAQVLVGVNRYETFNLDELGVRPRLDEGILHVIAVRALDKKLLSSLTGQVKLAGSASGVINQWTNTEFSISDPSGQLETGIDGENVLLPSPVRIKILPKALRLMVPAEGNRSRPVKPFSAKAAQTLWDLATRRGT